MTEPDPRYEDLLSLIHRQAGRYRNKTFMTFGDGSTMSYGEFEERVAAARSQLWANDIRRGAVALMMKNSLFSPVAWLGIVTARCIAVPINSRLRMDDARFVLEHSGAVADYSDASTHETLRTAGAAVLGPILAEPDPGIPSAPEPAVHACRIANLQYTSVTAGFPKGCLLTHRYWQRMGSTAVELMGIEGDTLLTSQPHSYIDPQWNVIATLRAAPISSFSMAFTVHLHVGRRSLRRHTLLLPRRDADLAIEQPEGASDRDHSLKRVFCSAIPPELHGAIEDRWGVPWSETFGMTDTGINTVVTADEHDACMGSGSIGRAAPHNEAAIVDERDRELPAGEVGELVFRGLGLMEGYHNDPEATAAFLPQRMGSHGRPRLARCAGVHLPAGPAQGDDQARGERTSRPSRSRPPSRRTPMSSSARWVPFPTTTWGRRSRPT
jgi:carnitine-CoA ligase